MTRANAAREGDMEYLYSAAGAGGAGAGTGAAPDCASRCVPLKVPMGEGEDCTQFCGPVGAWLRQHHERGGGTEDEEVETVPQPVPHAFVVNVGPLQ